MSKILHQSRMISHSKSGYAQANPDNVIVFNANLVKTKNAEKFWSGDLDVTKDSPELIEMAKKLGESFYVLREMDARFENEANPKVENAVALVTAENVLILEK